jgi:hypothetical protein
MLVEESRMLEVSIFDTLHKNDIRVEVSVLLFDLMVIADEADLQCAHPDRSGGAQLCASP